jgi:hypothetical protein
MSIGRGLKGREGRGEVKKKYSFKKSFWKW